MPDVLFLWFGGGNHALIPKEIKKLWRKNRRMLFCRIYASCNSTGCILRSGCVCIFSYEETEGIVVLEALSCEIPVIVRDIPVYEKWLEDGVQVRKATDPFSYEQALREILSGEQEEEIRCRTQAGRVLAEEHSMRATGENCIRSSRVCIHRQNRTGY